MRKNKKKKVGLIKKETRDTSRSSQDGNQKYYEVLAYMPDHVQEIYYSLPSFNAKPPQNANVNTEMSNPQEGEYSE